MALPPLSPRGVVRGKFGKPTLVLFPLDPHQPYPERVPERVRFPVVQDEGVPVSPPRDLLVFLPDPGIVRLVARIAGTFQYGM